MTDFLLEKKLSPWWLRAAAAVLLANLARRKASCLCTALSRFALFRASSRCLSAAASDTAAPRGEEERADAGLDTCLGSAGGAGCARVRRRPAGLVAGGSAGRGDDTCLGSDTGRPVCDPARAAATRRRSGLTAASVRRNPISELSGCSGLAIGETVILLHPPLPLVGVSIETMR